VFREYDSYINLRPKGIPPPQGFGPRLMRVKLFARVYERYWRPTFVSVAMAGRADLRWEKERICELFSSTPEGGVLDLGCGPGFMARYLARKKMGTTIYALDASRPMIEEAASHVPEEGASPISWLLADVEGLPFASNTLSGVHAGAFLHVLPAPDAAIKEAARVLKPSGAFFASTFIRPGNGPVAKVAQRAFDRLASIHVFSSSDLRRYVADAGLVDYKTVIRGGFVYLTARKPGPEVTEGQ